MNKEEKHALDFLCYAVCELALAIVSKNYDDAVIEDIMYDSKFYFELIKNTRCNGE